MIVDAHLDLAYNVTRGRDVRLPASMQPIADGEVATVGLPDLREGGVELICATLYAEPARAGGARGYRDAAGAHAQAVSQLGWYREQFDAHLLQLVANRGELSSCDVGVPPTYSIDSRGRDAQATRIILLLEGADPIRTPADVEFFFRAGVRVVGLAWGKTRYAGGTGTPGPLTSAGIDLLPELDRFGIIHDASHLADESFWQLVDLSSGPIMASHSNCRAIVPGDRHLSDEMIREIVKRGGVIGINFYDKFLLPPPEAGKRRATLADVVRHVRHICDLAGNANHVALGTDLDGGLGREQIPVEIRTIADLPKLTEALRSRGFGDDDVQSILGGNWMRFFEKHLGQI